MALCQTNGGVAGSVLALCSLRATPPPTSTHTYGCCSDDDGAGDVLNFSHVHVPLVRNRAVGSLGVPAEEKNRHTANISRYVDLQTR